MQLPKINKSIVVVRSNRDDTFAEPEVLNPPKAFRVQRIVGMRGIPYWEKNILKGLGLIYNVSIYV